jgi:hypothetical protein
MKWKALSLVLAGVLVAGEAAALVGRPLTPMSYAGVARRTTRRTVAVAATAPVYAAPHAVVTPAPVVVAPAPVYVAPVVAAYW